MWPRIRQARDRVSAGLAQGEDAADRLCGIAADDRIGAVEHAFHRRIDPAALHLAKRVAAGAESEAVLERRAHFRRARQARLWRWPPTSKARLPNGCEPPHHDLPTA